MGVFVLHPKGMSDITFNLVDSSPESDYHVAQAAIQLNEAARLKIAYGEGDVSGFVRKSRHGLVPIQFRAVVFGADQATAMANLRILVRAITSIDGGTLEYKPQGLAAGVMSTYYHYFMSRPPAIIPGGMNQIQMEKFYQAQHAGEQAIVCDIELMTDAWATSDPSTYVTALAATNCDNEGTSVILDSSAIKGDALLGFIQVAAKTGADPTTGSRSTIIYKRRMRTSDNTELEWIEAEDMSAPGTDYLYGFFCGITWEKDQGFAKYPTDIVDNSWNHQGEVSGTRSQADGDDVRVYDSGRRIDHWMEGENTSTAQIWCNLDFAPVVLVDLAADIDDAAVEIPVVANALSGTDCSSLPSSGIIKMGTEYIKYHSKDDELGILYTNMRGYGNSTPASHNAGAIGIWIQHDLWVCYGDLSAASMSPLSKYEPIIDISQSTNQTWVFLNFGDNARTRTGAWTRAERSPGTRTYTANHVTYATPWSEMGIDWDGASSPSANGEWYLWNPWGINNANFQSGETYFEGTTGWIARIRSSTSGYTWTTEYNIPMPSPSTWTAWSRNEAVTAGSAYVTMGLFVTDSHIARVEVSRVDVTFADWPQVTIGQYISIGWVNTVDADVSGGEYETTQSQIAARYISTIQTAGMDSTYLGKVTPIIICKCSPESTYKIRYKIYMHEVIGAQATPIYVSRHVTLTGSTYWKCIYDLEEFDFPPFAVPDTLEDDDVEDFIAALSIVIEFERVQGSQVASFDIDVVCLAKASEWISHVYNDVDGYGIDKSPSDTLVVDAIRDMTYSFVPGYLPRMIWKNEGMPLSDLVFDAGYDYRIRVFGFVDDETREYVQENPFTVTVMGIYLTIYPFEVA